MHSGSGVRLQLLRQQRSQPEAFYTVYYKPPPDPRARRRRRLLLRIGLVFCLAAFATGPIVFAVLRAQSECSIDIHCVSSNQWLLRRRRDAASVRRKNQTSMLLIVAHPNDEVVWAGKYLLEHGSAVHVMVTSTKHKEDKARGVDSALRSDGFKLASEKFGFSGEFLWGLDGPWKLERSIRRRIVSRVCDRPWDSIVTHGHDGEYGDPQHQAVHDAVVEAVYFCCNSTNRLRVFQPDPTFVDWEKSYDTGDKSTRKDQIQNVLGIVAEQRLFGNWTEHIVPYDEFDSDLAGKACRTAQSRWGHRKQQNTCRGGGDSDSSDLYRAKQSFKAKGWC